MDSFEGYYKSIGKVYCPYFKGYVLFTNVGLDHIRFKNTYTARVQKDRYIREKLLPITLEILGQSHTVQGETYRKRFERRSIHNRVETVLVMVTYYEFVAIIETIRAKVIIKQTEHEEKIFLSVIPLFKQKMPPFDEDDML